MKSLKSAARSGLLATVTLASTLVLGACSAGQITQTADQVPAVNGTSADSQNKALSVRDVTVIMTPDSPQPASLRFIVTNQDPNANRLQKVTVDGQEVSFQDQLPEIGRDCTLYSDSSQGLNQAPKDQVQQKQCINRVANTIPNKSFTFGGHVPVTFTFDRGSVTTDATVNAPQLESGTFNRPVEGGEEGHAH
ncbi:hypothetical protein [Corynebacterium poyangense]|uniref:hypothetical protein n=1 Tax=Corynebacterium poyangense TaxID=2684405 RepID=UPI001CCA8B39|nr:hypothetical protein [Corynebacterium poyangense]